MLDRLDQTTDTDFWQHWQQHQEELYRCCLKAMGGNQTEAEDALNAAMLKAREAWRQQIEPIEHVKAWLMKLTNNLCTDILEKRDRSAVGFPMWRRSPHPQKKKPQILPLPSKNWNYFLLGPFRSYLGDCGRLLSFI